MLTELQATSRDFERAGVHDARATLRELAFGPLRIVQQQVFAGEQFQNGVTQEFQALVILHNGATESDVLATSGSEFGDGGTVRQGAVQQKRVAKEVPEALHQPVIFTAGHGFRSFSVPRHEAITWARSTAWWPFFWPRLRRSCTWLAGRRGRRRTL